MGNQIKRTTLMVRGMDRSLEFFRDVLGAKVWSDRPFTLDGGGLPIGKKGDKLRLCIIKFDHDEIGMVGSALHSLHFYISGDGSGELRILKGVR